MTEVESLIISRVESRNVRDSFEGKCVADIHLDIERQFVLLTFTDGTFSEIRMSSSYNELDFAQTDARCALHYLDAGLLGYEEDHFRNLLQVEDDAYMRGIEYRRYLELKEKYEPTTSD